MSSPTLSGIPSEIREQIFKQFFTSITVSYGFGKYGSTNTSILRTCSLFYKEAKHLLHRFALFNFSGSTQMAAFLRGLSPEDIQNIRHVRVVGNPFNVFHGPTGRSDSPGYTMDGALSWVQSLQLDCLTVEYPSLSTNFWWAIPPFQFLQPLVRTNGWKELQVILPSVFVHTYALAGGDGSLTVPQVWNQLFQARDGLESSTETTAYIAHVSRVKGALENLASRPIHRPFEMFQGEVDGNGGLGREIMVVVKRGKAGKVMDTKMPAYNDAIPMASTERPEAFRAG